MGLRIKFDGTNGKLTWSDDIEFDNKTDWVPWAPGHPNATEGYCAASFRPEEDWQLHDCSDSSVYGVCISKPNCPPVTLSDEFSTDPTNLTLFSSQSEIGTVVHHKCNSVSKFSDDMTEKTYTCLKYGNWTNLTTPCTGKRSPTNVM